MAKVVEQYVVIKMSKLAKNDENVSDFLSDEIKESLESVVEELVDDDSVIVEVESGE